MKYYVVADIHGFFDEFVTALEEKEFFTETAPHKLIVCGDLFDRGQQALKLQQFILELLQKDEVILIRGNHEDLLIDLITNMKHSQTPEIYDITNGTVDTIIQLTGEQIEDIFDQPCEAGQKTLLTPALTTIIPAMRDFYETENYIFVHGWIPCVKLKRSKHENQYYYADEWRNSSADEWKSARWTNGMEAAHNGVIESKKTIVCGHWHSSFGHSRYEGKGKEFDDNPDFTPYYGEGIIALDGCTAISHRVNCIVVDD